MKIDIMKPLRKALAQLEAERKRISRQIDAIQELLGANGPRRQGRRGRAAPRRKSARRTMSAAARKAVSRRMKAYWNKRKADEVKGKGQAGK